MDTYGVDVAIQVGTLVMVKAESQEEADSIVSRLSISDLENAVSGASTPIDYCLVKAVGSAYDRMDESWGRFTGTDEDLSEHEDLRDTEALWEVED